MYQLFCFPLLYFGTFKSFESIDTVCFVNFYLGFRIEQTTCIGKRQREYTHINKFKEEFIDVIEAESWKNVDSWFMWETTIINLLTFWKISPWNWLNIKLRCITSPLIFPRLPLFFCSKYKCFLNILSSRKVCNILNIMWHHGNGKSKKKKKMKIETETQEEEEEKKKT